MFVSVRKYQNVKSVEEIKALVQEHFVPKLKLNPGFKGYYMLDCASPDSGNIVTTISMFDNWDAALASNNAAKDFVKHLAAHLLPEAAQAVSGEVIISA